jgi:hypothetical protein
VSEHRERTMNIVIPALRSGAVITGSAPSTSGLIP